MFCLEFQLDLDEIETIRHSPKLSKRFQFVRYEDIALEPESELAKLVSEVGERRDGGMPATTFCRKTLDDLDREPDWNFDKNPVERIIVWKQKLSIENINTIEDRCLHVLSKLEYHIIGKEEP